MKQFILIAFFITMATIGQENFVLIGPPGSGKGTFSSYMTKNYAYYHICPGDTLRAHVKNDTELGKIIKPIIERGDDVDPTIVFKIVDEEISYCLSRNIPFIMDGFPRSIPTFEFLIKLFHEKGISSTITFVHFKIDNDTCLERVNNRIICNTCGAIFNKVTNKPQNGTFCDFCNHNLQTRIGDVSEITVKFSPA